MQPTSPHAAGQSGDEPSAVVTDLTTIAQETDAASLSDRRLELDGARVQSVTGDVTFWVESTETDRTFVVLNERAQGERAVTVREGQLLRITGTLERTPVDGAELGTDDRRALEDEILYIRAEHVEIESR